MKTWFRILCWTSSAAICAAITQGPPRATGGECFRKRACTQTGLPCYRYGHDDLRGRGSLIAGDMREEEVVQLLDSPAYSSSATGSGLPGQGIATPAPESVLLSRARPMAGLSDGADGSPPAVSPPTRIADQVDFLVPQAQKRATAVRRRKFTPATASLDVDHIRLTRVGLAIYETGRAAITGTLLSNGGPQGLIKGNYVTLRVRGFGANALSTLTPGGPMLFEFEKTVWVARGDQSTISLIPGDQCEHIRRHFDEISYIEINLEYRQNR